MSPVNNTIAIRSHPTSGQQRVEQEKLMNDRNSLSTPILKLPTEVLEYIFLIYQQTSFEDKGYIVICNPSTFIRVITQVCHRWRTIAMHYSLLWCNIDVNFQIEHGLRNLPAVVGMINTYVHQCIERSKNAPLSLSFSPLSTPALFSVHARKAIASTVWRWKNVKIGWELLAYIQKTFPEFHSCPQLHSLTILDNQSRNYPIDSHWTMPALTELMFRELSNPLGDIALPFSQITSFTSDNVTFNPYELQTLLSLMPSLTTLRLIGNTGRHVRETPVTLLNLQSLHLCGDDVEINSQLSSINAPQLKVLEFGYEFQRYNGCCDFYPSVQQLIRRSVCSLEEVTLHGNALNDGWGRGDTRTIKKLVLHRLLNNNFASDLLALTRDGRKDRRSSFTFPCLESIELHFDSDVRNTLPDLIGMLLSRMVPESDSMSGLTYLSNITVTYTKKLDGAYIELLKQFFTDIIREQSDRNITIVFRHGLYPDGVREEGELLCWSS